MRPKDIAKHDQEEQKMPVLLNPEAQLSLHTYSALKKDRSGWATKAGYCNSLILISELRKIRLVLPVGLRSIPVINYCLHVTWCPAGFF